MAIFLFILDDSFETGFCLKFLLKFISIYSKNHFLYYSNKIISLYEFFILSIVAIKIII